MPLSVRTKPALIAAVFALLCVAVLGSRPAVTQWSPDCASKYLQLMSIHFDHGLHMNVPYVGKPFDPDMTAIPMGESYYDRRGGEIHMAWPALFPLVTYPFRQAFGWFGIFVLPIVCGAISVWLTGALADRIRPGTGWIASLLLAVSTPVLIYSTLYWEHTIALALELGALALVMEFSTTRRRWALVVAGMLAGLGAAGFRGDVALFAAALFGAVFLVARGRDRWAVPPLVGVGFALGCFPGALLNLMLNGHISPPNAVNNTPPPSLAYLSSVHFVGILPHILVGKTVPGNLAWVTTIALAFLLFAYYANRRRSSSLLLVLLVGAAVTLGVASLLELDATRDNAFHGWLAMCPVLALGLLQSDAPLDDRSASARRVVLFTALGVFSLVCITIGVAYPYGWATDHNLEWGPRYWLVIFPLMAILCAVNHDAFVEAFSTATRANLWRWLALGSAAGLLIVGVLFIRIGLVRIRRLLVDQDQFRTLMIEQRDTPLLTDTFGMSALVPEAFASRPSFYVRFENADRFPRWLGQAVTHGLRSFALATFAGVDHPFLREPLAECECSLKVESIEKRSILSVIRLRVEGAPSRAPRSYALHGNVHTLYGGILKKYVTLGETSSYLGLPTTDERPSTRWCTEGRTVDFEHGAIDWCPNLGGWAHSDPDQGYPGRD
jgi:hypothetical protein